MWRIPVPLISGGQAVTLTITSDVLIGNLFNFLGSPAGPQDVFLIIDGADVGAIQVTADWAGGSTFQFTCINGGRILGLGGLGGNGVSYSGSPGGGSNGTNGGYAIQSNGFTVNVDIDDGFLLGGGGGGGGGGGQQTGSFVGAAGGGGGGGQGFNATTGGAAGTQPPTQNPPAQAGQGGTRSAPGSGGQGGSPVFTNTGGAGGSWGSGGQAGTQVSQYTLQPGFLSSRGARIGGRGGAAFEPVNAGAINFNGAKDEATLRLESRIKGDVSRIRPVYNFSFIQTRADVSVMGSNTTGTVFRSDGDINQGDLTGGGPLLTNQWLPVGSTAPNAAIYEIRERNGANDISGTWSQRVNATPGDWSALTSSRTQAISSSSGITGAGTMMEIRRNDVPGNPDNEIICTFYCFARDENGV